MANPEFITKPYHGTQMDLPCEHCQKEFSFYKLKSSISLRPRRHYLILQAVIYLLTISVVINTLITF